MLCAPPIQPDAALACSVEGVSVTDVPDVARFCTMTVVLFGVVEMPEVQRLRTSEVSPFVVTST